MKTLIGIPTLNEKLNVKIIYSKIRKFDKKSDILFFDDNSKDGTIEEIKKIISKDNKVFLKKRSNKLGIGSAHKEIIKYSFKKQYYILITMDADGTHDPKYMSKMLKKIKSSDVVITNRFYYPDSIKSWPLIRKAITYTRHFLINFLLSINFDTSGAYRVYKLKKIKLIDLMKAKHNGYSFFWESIYILSKNNYKIIEIPILMKTRTYGSSKISIYEIISAIFYLFYIFLKRILNLKI